MGTGYESRNDSSNNIADGNVINASDIDGEFEAILAAFGTGGHTHDGTAGEGGAIEKIGPGQQYRTTSTAFHPDSDGVRDLGTNSLEFRDLYIDGTAYIDGLGEDILVAADKKIQLRDTAIFINSSTDGQLDIDADGELEITAPIVDINASTRVDISTDLTVGDDLTLASDGAIINFGEHSEIVLTHVHDTGLLLSSVNTGNLLHLKSTEAGTSAGPVLVIERDSASPADDDLGGSILFKADSDGNNSRNIAKITTQVKDVSNGTEDSEVIFSNIVAGTETAQITLGTGITFGTALTINSGINVDNFNIDGTTIALSAGDMTLDSAADIVLDAAGEQVIFKDGSANIGHVDMTSDNLTIKSLVSDKDIIFQGNDGGSDVTALTLDMSEAGNATFNANVTVGGTLTVNGTTTTVNTATLVVEDPLIKLAKANDGADSVDIGFYGLYDTSGTDKYAGLFRDASDSGNFKLFKDLQAEPSTTVNTSGTGYAVGTLVANLTGDVTGDVTGNVAGNTTGTNIGTLKKTASDTEFTLPASDGSSGQFLKTDASGNLSFGTATQTTINSNTDHQVITGTGTANTLQGESGLTYNGTTLAISGTITSVTNITASGTIQGAEVTATSDERLKSNIQTIDNPLDKVMSMRGVTYTMQDQKGTGVIAQEVEKVLPEVVVDGEEYKSVAYGNMVGVLIEAIKELKTEIDTHKQGCKCHGSSD